MPQPVRTFRSAGRYAQGAGALALLGEHVRGLGAAPLVVADDVVWRLTGDAVARSFGAAGLPVVRAGFPGRTTAAAVDALAVAVREAGADVVVAVGGGSTLDAVKAASALTDVRCVVVPTVASTDGPCSALAAMVTDDGAFAGYRFLARNPDLVLVDTRLVAAAPVRFLVAGIGDALATWVEARAVAAAGSTTITGGAPLATGTALARLSWDLLHEHAVAAVAAVRRREVTEDVERVVEAAVLLSGLGFESGGLAAAHAIHDGLTAVPQTRALMHGEKVNLGTLAQLVLEGRSDEARDLVTFTTRLGLPTTLTEVGLSTDDDDALARVARAATGEGEPMHAMPFAVSAADVVAALRSVEQVARAARAEAGLPAPVPPAPR